VVLVVIALSFWNALVAILGTIPTHSLRNSQESHRVLPSSLGWYQMLKTQALPLCLADPSIRGVAGCSVNNCAQNACALRLTSRSSSLVVCLADAKFSHDARSIQSIQTLRPAKRAVSRSSPTSISGVVTPEQDFQARCRAPGVVKCVGWDDPSDFIPASGGKGYADGLYPASDGTYQGTMDSAVKTSGAGSLRFTIRPNARANWTGYWRANFGPLDDLTKFGPHTTLYLQFRFRLDPEMLNFDWSKVGDTGWKMFIAYGPIPGPSCTGAQFVQENSYQWNIATGYTSCGSPALYTNHGKPPMFIEQGDYNCPYRSSVPFVKNLNCFAFLANTWMTEYWVVEIGDFGQPNTHFTAYIATEGQPLKRFIDLPNFTFNAGANAGDALETILLGPYMSGANGTKISPTAYMWFDELIISTKPIAAPSVRPEGR